MRTELTDIICSTLGERLAETRRQFSASTGEVGFRYCHVDNLLREEIVGRIHKAFPEPERMRLMSSFRERKYTSKNFDTFDPLLKEITFAFQDPRVIRIIEQITGISSQIADPTLYAGGLSMMGMGHFLNPHIDNSHDASRRYYRTLNLLYYVTPGWSLDHGGNLELWDKGVRQRVTIESRFNRLVIMETNPRSWHSVSRVRIKDIRCCVSNYYFSAVSPTGSDYFNVTSFSAPPDRKFMRGLAWVDNKLRQAVRTMVPPGLGRQDIYKGARE